MAKSSDSVAPKEETIFADVACSRSHRRPSRSSSSVSPYLQRASGHTRKTLFNHRRACWLHNWSAVTLLGPKHDLESLQTHVWRTNSGSGSAVIIATESSRANIIDRFGSTRLTVIDCFTDPSGWLNMATTTTHHQQQPDSSAPVSITLPLDQFISANVQPACMSYFMAFFHKLTQTS